VKFSGGGELFSDTFVAEYPELVKFSEGGELFSDTFVVEYPELVEFPGSTPFAVLLCIDSNLERRSSAVVWRFLRMFVVSSGTDCWTFRNASATSRIVVLA
jgi:hypothetical protein